MKELQEKSRNVGVIERMRCGHVGVLGRMYELQQEYGCSKCRKNKERVGV